MPHFLPHKPNALTAETRAVAERLAAALSGDADGTDLFNGTHLWVQGSAWWSGDIDAEQAGRIQARFHACIQSGAAGLKHETRSIIADGNKASIEMRLSGTWYDGREFAKDIHIAIDVLENQIINYREYGFDDTFFALEAEDGEERRPECVRSSFVGT
jgi:ketosteroid isomerase-like protein